MDKVQFQNHRCPSKTARAKEWGALLRKAETKQSLLAA